MAKWIASSLYLTEEQSLKYTYPGINQKPLSKFPFYKEFE